MPGDIVKGSVSAPPVAVPAELLGIACLGCGLTIDDGGRLAVAVDGDTSVTPSATVALPAAEDDPGVLLCPECDTETNRVKYRVTVAALLGAVDAADDTVNQQLILALLGSAPPAVCAWILANCDISGGITDVGIECDAKGVLSLTQDGASVGSFNVAFTPGTAFSDPQEAVTSGSHAPGDLVNEACVTICLPCAVPGLWVDYNQQVSNDLEQNPVQDPNNPDPSDVGFRGYVAIDGGTETSFNFFDYIQPFDGSAGAGGPNGPDANGPDTPFGASKWVAMPLAAGVHEVCFRYRVELNNIFGAGKALVNQGRLTVGNTQGVCH